MLEHIASYKHRTPRHSIRGVGFIVSAVCVLGTT